MAECIDRQAAIDALTERNLVVHMDSVNDGLVASCHRSAQRIIANLHTADVRPVVLCRDCIHSEPWYADKSRCFLWRESGIDVFNDGFCNYGVRREES